VTLTIGTQGLIEDDVLWRLAAGADAVATFTLWQDETKTTPTDLTGASGACQVRTKLGGDLLGDALVELGGDTGVVTVTIPAAVSAAWSAKQRAAVFDVELTDADGTISRLCSGSLDILPNVTTGLES